MKRRTSRPLLRASSVVVGAAMLACGGPTGAEAPVEPPVPEAPVKPVELAETREVNVSVSVPEGYTYKGHAMVTMDIGQKEPVNLGSLTIYGPGPYTMRSTVDHRVVLPREVTIRVVMPADDDEATPSRGDLVGETTGLVGEVFHVEATRYMPIVKAVVAAHSNKPFEDEQYPPVYANTKGSHHYEPPPPTQMMKIDLEGPDEPALREVALRFVLSADPLADELRVALTVPRLPAEIHVEAPPGTWVPRTFEVFVDAGVGTPEHRSARADSMLGDTFRAVLRKP